jgi:hypothetical protein
MRLHLTCLAFATFVTSINACAQQIAVSVYTDISSNACSKFIDDESTGARTLECPGVQGYRLHILEDDERSSIDVITPDKRVLPLNYWDVVTRGFSTLGGKVEWRIAKAGGQAAPVAIIVRVNTLDQSDPEHPKRAALLAVAKISVDAACVTKVVNAQTSNANKEARRFSDNQHLSCLPVD